MRQPTWFSVRPGVCLAANLIRFFEEIGVLDLPSARSLLQQGAPHSPSQAIHPLRVGRRHD